MTESALSTVSRPRYSKSMSKHGLCSQDHESVATAEPSIIIIKWTLVRSPLRTGRTRPWKGCMWWQWVWAMPRACVVSFLTSRALDVRCASALDLQTWIWYVVCLYLGKSQGMWILAPMRFICTITQAGHKFNNKIVVLAVTTLWRRRKSNFKKKFVQVLIL